MRKNPIEYSFDTLSRLVSTKEFWDSPSAEWSNSTTEEKLLILGAFVNGGGDLYKVVEDYAERHDAVYRREIQNTVLHYLAILMTGKEFTTRIALSDRIKRLNKEELIQLLTEELKRNVLKSGEIDANGYVKEFLKLSNENLLNDDILDRIEREHWRANPDEAFSSYLFKAELNWNYSRGLW